ncbi:MAG: copper amine oxidase N-terminal domain-containing protein [Defluviitaleaceae bacterium]|nr:copper amine oxidase N-terminal domain-containing protein [Defluviitaleaceae bacterium]
MKERTLRKRAFAWVLAVMMVFTMIPAIAVADGGYSDDYLSFVVEESVPAQTDDNVVPFSTRQTLSVPQGRTAVYHLSDNALMEKLARADWGLSPEDDFDGFSDVPSITGLIPAGDGDGGVFTLLSNGAIRIQSGTTQYAGSWQGLDVVPEYFEGLQVGDTIQVIIELSALQAGNGGNMPTNSGFRVEAAEGHEAPAPNSRHAAGATSVPGTLTPGGSGHSVAVGSMITITVPVTEAFINSNMEVWGWCDTAENRRRFAHGTPACTANCCAGETGIQDQPSFRIAGHVIIPWVFDNGGPAAGTGGWDAIIHDILVHGERAPSGLTVEEANTAIASARVAVENLLPAAPIPAIYGATVTALTSAINGLNIPDVNIAITPALAVTGADPNRTLTGTVTFTVPANAMMSGTAHSANPLPISIAVSAMPTDPNEILASAVDAVEDLIVSANFDPVSFADVDDVINFVNTFLYELGLSVLAANTNLTVTPAVNGTESSPDGVDGSISGTITLSLEGATPATISINVDIPAVPYDVDPSIVWRSNINQSLAAALSAGETVNNLMRSGDNTAFSVVDGALVVSNRTESWHALDISLEEMGLVDGTNYSLTVKGAGATNQLQLLFPLTAAPWDTGIVTGSGGEVSMVFTSTMPIVDGVTVDPPRIRVRTNGTDNITITEIVIRTLDPVDCGDCGECEDCDPDTGCGDCGDCKDCDDGDVNFSCAWCRDNGCNNCRGTTGSGGTGGGGGGSWAWWTTGVRGGIGSGSGRTVPGATTTVPRPTPAPAQQTTPGPEGNVLPVPSTGASILQLNLGSASYSLNGSVGSMDVAPVSIDGRTMVPFRFIGEALGAQIGWNDATRTATFTLGTNVVSVTIGQPLYDGTTYMGTPVIENGRTLVPVRFISVAMGAEVEWVPPSTVIVRFGGQEAPVAEEPVAEDPIEEEIVDEETPDDEEPVTPASTGEIIMEVSIDATLVASLMDQEAESLSLAGIDDGAASVKFENGALVVYGRAGTQWPGWQGIDIMLDDLDLSADGMYALTVEGMGTGSQLGLEWPLIGDPWDTGRVTGSNGSVTMTFSGNPQQTPGMTVSPGQTEWRIRVNARGSDDVNKGDFTVTAIRIVRMS